jgi:predicted Zn-dependent protease
VTMRRVTMRRLTMHRLTMHRLTMHRLTMHRLTVRRVLGELAKPLAACALAAALALAGCAQSPATGRNIFTGGLSPEDEVELGREQHPQIVQEFGGAYDDPELTAYVDSLGQLLAQTSELPALEWHFTVLDSPIINAFALPGGYVYVTRGLLALADNEAELAGVLAHEIGHVTARHSAERYGQSVLGTAAAVGVGVLLGSEAAAQATSGAAELAVLSYSRDQEFEADTLGVRYLSRSGHDPQAMSSFLRRLLGHSRYEAELAGRPEAADAFDITQTHPRTADRVERAIEAAGGRQASDPIVARDLYLDKIDGLVYGDSPAQGYVRGRRFLHPELGFAFEVPEGFELVNTPNRVIAQNEAGAAILFDRAKQTSAGSMTRYLADVWARDIELRDLQAIDVNGQEAATAWTRLDTRQGKLDFRLVAIRFGDGAIYRFLFVTPPDRTAALNEPLRRTAHSFRPLSAGELAELEPYRIEIYQVQPGDTPESLARRMPLGEESLGLLRVLNGLREGEALAPGRKVKLVTA